MKIAVGIMGYDSWDEFKINSDIIKSFSKDYYVLAASSHPTAKKNLNYKNIDEVVSINPIPFDPKKSKKHLNWSMRVTNNIQLTNNFLLNKSKFDYIVFLHSDSWILSKKTIPTIIKLMKNQKKYFACRGRGFGFNTPAAPFGALDDMFFIYDSKFIKSSKLFDFDVIEQLPHIQDSHGIISSNLITKIGLSKILIYSDTSNMFFYKSKFLREKTNKFRFTNHTTPTIYDPKYSMIHVHTGAYFHDIGKKLQAFYLKKYNLTGITINKFINNYLIDEKSLFNQIKKLDNYTKLLLCSNFITYDSLGWGKNYRKIIQTLKSIPLSNRIKLILNCWVRGSIIKIFTKERYYNYFYGATNLRVFYNKNLLYKQKLKKLGHSEWYKKY